MVGMKDGGRRLRRGAATARGKLIAVGTVAALTAGGAAAFAAGIPDSGTGVINACYLPKTGIVRVIDPAAKGKCLSVEKPLTWNQKGVKGDTGAQGPAGPVGPAGAKGETGAAGAKGPQGEQGPKGDAGADGKDGATGPHGEQGPQGEKGDTGATGAPGADGKDGATGPQGEQGPKGDAGADGKDGATGPQGEQGPKGDAGADGKDGATGPQGEQGPKGDNGADGKDGKDGATGSAGPTGTTASVVRTAVNVNRATTATVSCQGPTPRAIGGGGSVDSGSLLATQPLFSGDGSAGATGWSATGSDKNAKITVYVICAP